MANDFQEVRVHLRSTADTKAVKMFRVQMQQLQKEMGAAMRMFDFPEADKLKNKMMKLSKSFRNVTKNNKAMTQSFNVGADAASAFRGIFGDLAPAASNTTSRFRGFLNTMNQLRGAMLMLSLSMLFFGMAIKRVFEGIMRSATQSFNKIMESSGYFGSAIQRLGVYWEYLKFTIGSALNTALMPLMPYIIQIINAVTRWIQENPKLTAGLIALGVILGTILLVFGTLGAAFTGISGFFTSLGLTVPTAGAAIEGFTAALSGMGLTVGLILAAIVVFVIGFVDAWKKNFMGIRENVKGVFEAVKKIFEGVWKIIKGVMGLIVGIITGDWEKVKDSVWLILSGIVDIITGTWDWITNLIKIAQKTVLNIVVNLFNLVKDAYTNFSDWIKGRFGAFLTWLGDKLGIDLIGAWETVQSKLQPILDWVGDKINWLINIIKTAWDWLVKIMDKAKEAGAGLVGKAINAGKSILGFATGGTVPGPLGSPQLIQAHGGERVVDQSMSNTFGGINITVNTTGGVNASDVADRLMSEIRRRTNLGGI